MTCAKFVDLDTQKGFNMSAMPSNPRQELTSSSSCTLTRDVVCSILGLPLTAPNKTVRSRLASMIDHTFLNPYKGQNAFNTWATRATREPFAALAVHSFLLPSAREMVDKANEYRSPQENKTKVACSVNFPHGTNSYKTCVAQVNELIEYGVDEIDYVMNLAEFIEGHLGYVGDSILAMRSALDAGNPDRPRVLKVIIETGALNEEQIAAATNLACTAGADFISTTTCFGPRGVNVEDVRIIKENLCGNTQIKASGLIRTLEEVIEMVDAGATRIGSAVGIELLDQFDLLFDETFA